MATSLSINIAQYDWIITYGGMWTALENIQEYASDYWHTSSQTFTQMKQ
jgi:hypothetical protein